MGQKICAVTAYFHRRDLRNNRVRSAYSNHQQLPTGKEIAEPTDLGLSQKG